MDFKNEMYHNYNSIAKKNVAVALQYKAHL